MGGEAENCRPEPRGPSTFLQTLCIIIKGRVRASAFAETRAAFASPRRPSRIYLNAIPHSRTCTTDLGKRQPQPLLDHGRFGRDGPQNSGVPGGIEAADRLHVSDEDVAVVRLGDAVAERLERLDRLVDLLLEHGAGVNPQAEVAASQARRHEQHVLHLEHRLDVDVDVERDHGVSLYAERLYKPPWRATIRALPKNMRKIERRLSLPNRGNGTRKSAGKLTISRGADGAEAGVGKMIGRIYRVELAVCNLNRSAVCFVMADAARNVPKYVRIGAARLYTLAFGCQLICDQPEIRRRSGSSNSDFPLGS